MTIRWINDRIATFGWSTLAVCGFAAASVSAQAPAGYHLGAAIAIPDSVVEVLAGGHFRANILRSGRTPAEREMISLAERLYPDAETLLAAAKDTAERNRLISMASGQVTPQFKVPQRDAGNPNDRWWLDRFDATWIPFAVTAGSVDYYLGRFHDLAAGRSEFKSTPFVGSDEGKFYYTATVLPGSGAGIFYVVELRIQWEFYCGQLCAVSFVHTRHVSFDKEGKVVSLTGDERPVVIVS